MYNIILLSLKILLFVPPSLMSKVSVTITSMGKNSNSTAGFMLSTSRNHLDTCLYSTYTTYVTLSKILKIEKTKPQLFTCTVRLISVSLTVVFWR